MAGVLDKIKGMFGGKKAATGEAADGGGMDTVKEKAGEIKDKVDDLVEKVGDKVPEQVKEAYEKVSDKIEDIIPGGDKPGDAE
jgi:gas vesicle protein